jgi:hypothetical protein
MRVSGIRAQRDDELSLYRGSMRSAMARFLTVNDFSGSPPVPRGNQGLNLDPESTAAPDFGIAPTGYGIEPGPSGIEPTPYGVASTDRKNSDDQGPCLYLGPQGQRCDRPAIANGFCARHLPEQLNQSARFGATSAAQPGVASPGSKPYGGVASPGSKPFARIIAVGIAIFAALWPVIADLLREIIRWIHAH